MDRAYHDQICLEYDSVVDEPRALMNSVLFGPVFQAANANSNSMLDLGCGTGQMVRRASELLPLTRVVCVDHSEGMLRVTKERFEDAFESFSAIKSDLTSFVHLCNDQFDLISCVGVLHHLRRNELLDFLTEVRKLLKRDGVLIVAEPIDNESLRSPAAWLQRWNSKSFFSGRHYAVHPEDPDESPLAEGELDELITKSGFEIEIARSIVEVFPRNQPPSILDQLVTKIVAILYRNSGFIRAIAAKSTYPPSMNKPHRDRGVQ